MFGLVQMTSQKRVIGLGLMVHLGLMKSGLGMSIVVSYYAVQII